MAEQYTQPKPSDPRKTRGSRLMINETSPQDEVNELLAQEIADTPLETVEQLNARAAEVAHELIDDKLAAASHADLIDYIVEARQKDIDTNAAESILVEKLDDLFAAQNVSLEEQNRLLDQISARIYDPQQDVLVTDKVSHSEAQTGFKAPLAIEAPRPEEAIDAEIVEEESELDERQSFIATRLIEIREEADEKGEIRPSFKRAAEMAAAEYDRSHDIVDAEIVEDEVSSDDNVSRERDPINFKELFSPVAFMGRLQARKMWKANERAGMTPEQREKDMQRSGRRILGAFAVAATFVTAYASSRHGMDFNLFDLDMANAASQDNLPPIDSTNEVFTPDTAAPAEAITTPAPEAVTSAGGGEAVTQPVFSTEALTVERGEGLNHTFKELGIPKDKWAETLQKAGPKLVKMGEAYVDPSIGGYGLKGDGTLSRSALRTIADVAKTIK